MEIEAIENESIQKRQELVELDKEVTPAQYRLDNLLEREQISIETIEWQDNIKQELEKEGIPVGDLPTISSMCQRDEKEKLQSWQSGISILRL